MMTIEDKKTRQLKNDLKVISDFFGSDFFESASIKHPIINVLFRGLSHRNIESEDVIKNPLKQQFVHSIAFHLELIDKSIVVDSDINPIKITSKSYFLENLLSPKNFVHYWFHLMSANYLLLNNCQVGIVDESRPNATQTSVPDLSFIKNKIRYIVECKAEEISSETSIKIDKLCEDISNGLIKLNFNTQKEIRLFIKIYEIDSKDIIKLCTEMVLKNQCEYSNKFFEISLRDINDFGIKDKKYFYKGGDYDMDYECIDFGNPEKAPIAVKIKINHYENIIKQGFENLVKKIKKKDFRYPAKKVAFIQTSFSRSKWIRHKGKYQDFIMNYLTKKLPDYAGIIICDNFLEPYFNGFLDRGHEFIQFIKDKNIQLNNIQTVLIDNDLVSFYIKR